MAFGAFQASAFQNNAFQVDTASGGSSGVDSGAFADAYLKFRRVVEDESKKKPPEQVLEVIKEVAQEAVSAPKKERGKILRSKIRGLGEEVNILYIQMLEGLIQQYLESLAELEVERARQDEEDLAIIMLLLS